MPTALTKTASDIKTGMTLGELRHFLDTATQQGARDTQPVKGRVTVRGGIRALTIQSEHDDNT